MLTDAQDVRGYDRCSQETYGLSSVSFAGLAGNDSTLSRGEWRIGSSTARRLVDAKQYTSYPRNDGLARMRRLGQALLLVGVQACAVAALVGQEPQFDAVPGASVIERPAPGVHAPYEGRMPGSIIGSRPGSLRPRVPMQLRPRGPAHVAPGVQMPQAAQHVPRSVAVPNAAAFLFEVEDEGPPNGLTLDQAVQQLVSTSMVLRAKSLDIPQAQADVLTAGMHANPVVYFDGQLLPYKPYNSVTNPGGPAQSDLNVASPLDMSGKRQARVDVACAAQRVVEALYQDAVRQEIARLSSAYVDALVARLTLRTTRGGLSRLDEMARRLDAEKKDPKQTAEIRRQIHLQRQTLALALIDAESAWHNARRNLAILLNLSAQQAATLDLRGTLEEDGATPPATGQLITAALANRPDLAAYRLGLQRAGADVKLSRANWLPDAFLLYQPFTYQDNTPFNAPSSRSWAAGLTMTVPIFDRNQGNIRRAQVNEDQSRLELQVLQQRVVAEVEAACEEYQSTARGIEHIERELLPDAEKERAETLRGLRDGSVDTGTYLAVQRDLDDLGRQYRDLLVRHRRSMLNVNTVTGLRVFP